MDHLPIEDVLSSVIASVAHRGAAVVEAPPGAGKTTRVPRAILEAGLAGSGEVLVLEPRRMAARLAARRVATEMGERVGETVGFQVRFEEIAGPRTRLRFLTEGLLTRRLISDPKLSNVGVVVLDEIHERHLAGDLALTLIDHLRNTVRPDLRVLAMSATLDAAPIARLLGADVVRSEGRRFEVKVEYLGQEEATRPHTRLEDLVARAVRRAIREDPLGGDVLVFLPGASEIRRAREALEPFAAQAGIELAPLHGELPAEEQDRAITPGRSRKVILSTNVAETSVTIPGVATVVDSGLARVASHSPFSGLPALEVRKVSRASAAQRSGRAGRTGPGRAFRLYTRHDHDSRPEFDVPEILREDLAETALTLASLGESVKTGLHWLDAPPAAALKSAQSLLTRLGALDRAGVITETGRQMLRLPVHPRQARLALEATAQGARKKGALVAALLGERDLRDRRAMANRGASALPPSGPSDLLELVEAFEEGERARFEPSRLRRMGLLPAAVQAVDRARRQLESALPPARRQPTVSVEAEEATLLRATLAAYPDRVARRRAPGDDAIVLVGGGSARLDPVCVVRDAPLVVALDAEVRTSLGRSREEVRVTLASSVTEELLLDLFPEALSYEDAVSFNAEAERVECTERLLYEDLVLSESRAQRADPALGAARLFEEAKARGPRAFAPEGTLDAEVARIAFASNLAPDAGIASPGEAEILSALRSLCEGRRSFAELRLADLPKALVATLEPRARVALERLAPERVLLPGGRSVRVHYETGRPPFVESRLQDFFGMSEGPSVGGGRVPLVLHLLAPNGRAVQVTTDLSGFWARHYPALCRELRRRYPRHAWPEDPLTASPPPSATRRR